MPDATQGVATAEPSDGNNTPVDGLPTPEAILNAVKVIGPVIEGSIVLVSDQLDVIAGDGAVLLDHLRSAIVDAAGHDRFVVLIVDQNTRVQAFGPDDLTDALRNLAHQAG